MIVMILTVTDREAWLEDSESVSSKPVQERRLLQQSRYLWIWQRTSLTCLVPM